MKKIVYMTAPSAITFGTVFASAAGLEDAAKAAVFPDITAEDIGRMPLPLPEPVAVPEAAGEVTQAITCKDWPDNVQIEMKLDGKDILSAEVLFRGKDLTPGLYSGQTLGGDAYVYNEPASPGLKGLSAAARTLRWTIRTPTESHSPKHL